MGNEACRINNEINVIIHNAVHIGTHDKLKSCLLLSENKKIRDREWSSVETRTLYM
jgi:hypothetical protein